MRSKHLLEHSERKFNKSKNENMRLHPVVANRPMTPAETVEQRWWQPCANKCIFNSSKYIHFSMASDKSISFVCRASKRPGNNGDAFHVHSTVPDPSEQSLGGKECQTFFTQSYFIIRGRIATADCQSCCVCATGNISSVGCDCVPALLGRYR